MIHFDCHAHVYEGMHAVRGARYVPKSPAPLRAWLKNLEDHGLRGGVIVQVSFLGFDNSELCAALAKLDRTRFAGVAVVPLDVEETELARLVANGVRGIRWNLVRNTEIPDLKSALVREFLARLREHDLHLEIHLEGHRLAPYLGGLAEQGLKIVVDHFGLPTDPNPATDPFLLAMRALDDRQNIFVKFSARYRTGFDLTAHCAALSDLLAPGQRLWGSDWPHTQHEASVDYCSTFKDASQSMATSDLAAVKRLYGIDMQ